MTNGLTRDLVAPHADPAYNRAYRDLRQVVVHHEPGGIHGRCTDIGVEHVDVFYRLGRQQRDVSVCIRLDDGDETEEVIVSPPGAWFRRLFGATLERRVQYAVWGRARILRRLWDEWDEAARVRDGRA